MFLHRMLNGRPVARMLTAGPAPAGAGGPPPPLENTPPQVGTFSTLEALYSFSGMTVVVTMFNRLITHAAPTFTILGSPVLPILCGLGGLLIYLYNTTDPATHPTIRDRLFGFILAIVNTVQLYLACVGANSAL